MTTRAISIEDSSERASFRFQVVAVERPLENTDNMLFHISEEPDIACFEPRTSITDAEAVVWAVDQEHLRNYLLPRECPRVTFCARETTTNADRANFLHDARRVIAVEEAWLARIQTTVLYCYHFSPETFACCDAGAGYFVSRTQVYPVRVEPIAHVFDAIAATETTIQIVSNLWPLHDAVAASSLQFSMIRMRNALPRAD